MDNSFVDINLFGTDINQNIVSNELVLFFQEIYIAVNILPNEIYGIKDSIKLSRYLFNKYVTITQIKNDISTYINKHCSHAKYFDYKISVENIQAENKKDLIYVVFKVYAKDQYGEAQEYIQKFLLGS